MDLSQIRNDFRREKLSVKGIAESPFSQIEKWLKEAKIAECKEYTAMSLVTVAANGQPSIRIVLLKYIEEDGLLFFTNYNSRKGKQIKSNPKVAAHFFWPELERQVKIEGTIEKTSSEVSEKYFHSRPFESQISAIISPQSKEVPNRKYLEDLREAEIEKHLNGVPDRPENWGGYKIIPHRIEFWQGGAHRLHDRILFTKIGEGWKITRLAP